MIPKNIFQTHKSIKYINSNRPIKYAISTWLKHTKEFNYYFYTDDMCDNFIKNNFDENVYRAYSILPMAVMKADLWRYCVIYKYGGIYADTDTICKVNPNIFLKDSLLTISPELGIFFCQWVFAAPPLSPILKSIIDLSVERILNIPEIKGEHIIHYLTGPAVFTDGIEKYLKENNLPVFEEKSDYCKYPDKCLSVFEPHIFHKHFIIHLGSGSWENGWKNERYQKLL